MASPPAWLSGFKLPGYTGESRGKGDGVIADPATRLDPSAKAGPLVTPLPDARTIGDWITAIIPDQAKDLVDYVITAVGSQFTIFVRIKIVSVQQVVDRGPLVSRIYSRVRI